jgi:hypothetical protein
LAATGFATAQGVNQGGVKESPTAASPKGDTAAPMNAPAAKGAVTAAPGAASKEAVPQHAQGKPDAKTTGEVKVDGKSKASDSTTPTTTSKDMKNPTAETKPASDGKTAGEMKADGKTKASESTTTSKDLKTPTAETKPSASDSKTTGNAATSAAAAPPAKKRTQITTAMRQEKVEEVTNVNFNISIGTAVPSTVRYYPLPSRIVENLSGMAWIRFHPGARQVHHSSPAHPRDRLHHRRLNEFARQTMGNWKGGLGAASFFEPSAAGPFQLSWPGRVVIFEIEQY